tara:strand:+ start:380 stop:631 length:252 start_codon:yes stop_codon:yes gene_type:complete
MVRCICRYEDIQVGDTVYFTTPHSKEVKGKAVMFGPAGWVVNMGGRFGMPGIVGPTNFIRFRKGKNRREDSLGKWLTGSQSVL